MTIMLHDLHIPDDTSDLHRVCHTGWGVRVEGASTFDGAQMFFYKNCSSILEGRVIPNAFATESL